MTEAAENLNRLVSDAGGRMNESSEQSRNALMDVVGALRETFERANQKVDEQLGQAASGASEGRGSHGARDGEAGRSG